MQELPVETLQCIIDFIVAPKTWARFMRTCKALAALKNQNATRLANPVIELAKIYNTLSPVDSRKVPAAFLKDRDALRYHTDLSRTDITYHKLLMCKKIQVLSSAPISEKDVWASLPKTRLGQLAHILSNPTLSWDFVQRCRAENIFAKIATTPMEEYLLGHFSFVEIFGLTISRRMDVREDFLDEWFKSGICVRLIKKIKVSKIKRKHKYSLGIFSEAFKCKWNVKPFPYNMRHIELNNIHAYHSGAEFIKATPYMNWDYVAMCKSNIYSIEVMHYILKKHPDTSPIYNHPDYCWTGCSDYTGHWIKYAKISFAEMRAHPLYDQTMERYYLKKNKWLTWRDIAANKDFIAWEDIPWNKFFPVIKFETIL